MNRRMLRSLPLVLALLVSSFGVLTQCGQALPNMMAPECAGCGRSAEQSAPTGAPCANPAAYERCKSLWKEAYDSDMSLLNQLADAAAWDKAVLETAIRQFNLGVNAAIKAAEISSLGLPSMAKCLTTGSAVDRFAFKLIGMIMGGGLEACINKLNQEYDAYLSELDRLGTTASDLYLQRVENCKKQHCTPPSSPSPTSAPSPSPGSGSGTIGGYKAGR